MRFKKRHYVFWAVLCLPVFLLELKADDASTQPAPPTEPDISLKASIDELTNEAWKTVGKATPVAKFLGEFKKISELENTSVPSEQAFLVFKRSDYSIFVFKANSAAAMYFAFDRASLFIETKEGLRDDDSLAYWQYEHDHLKPVQAGGSAGGKDYSCQDLARFFTEAEKKKQPLNKLESEILAFLIEREIFTSRTGGIFKGPTDCAILVISAESSKADIEHEFNHGVYFSDSVFRAGATELYENLEVFEKSVVLDIMNDPLFMSFYDFSNNNDLRVREFLAYFRDPQELSSYYLDYIDFKHKHMGKTEIMPTLEGIAKKIREFESKFAIYKN